MCSNFDVTEISLTIADEDCISNTSSLFGTQSESTVTVKENPIISLFGFLTTPVGGKQTEAVRKSVQIKSSLSSPFSQGMTSQTAFSTRYFVSWVAELFDGWITVSNETALLCSADNSHKKYAKIVQIIHTLKSMGKHAMVRLTIA